MENPPSPRNIHLHSRSRDSSQPRVVSAAPSNGEIVAFFMQALAQVGDSVVGFRGQPRSKLSGGKALFGAGFLVVGCEG